jgi:hypothetical protein
MPPHTQDQTLPTWVGAASRLVTRHGIATVFACVLLWLLIIKLPDVLAAQLAEQAAATARVQQALNEHAEAVSTRGVEASAHEERMLALLEAICRGVNRGNPAAKEMCSAVRR